MTPIGVQEISRWSERSVDHRTERDTIDDISCVTSGSSSATCSRTPRRSPPSPSHSLSRAILHGIDWSKQKCIVELGAGTGPITEQLVKVAPPGTRLIVNEYLPEFCQALRLKFPTVDIVEGDARKLTEMLVDRGITQVDYVLSGLPLTHFKAEDRASVIDQAAKVLAPDGEFRQLTTAPWLYRKLYRRYFRDVEVRLVG